MLLRFAATMLFFVGLCAQGFTMELVQLEGPAAATVRDTLAGIKAPCPGNTNVKCRVSSLVSDASIVYGKLTDDENYYAVAFITTRDVNDTTALMLLVLDSKDNTDFHIVGFKTKMEGVDPRDVRFSGQVIQYTVSVKDASGVTPSKFFEMAPTKDGLIIRTIGDYHVVPKWFLFDATRAIEVGTPYTISLDTPFNEEAIRAALPGFKIETSTEEGITSIAASYPGNDRIGVVVYGSGQRITSIFSLGDAGDDMGIRVGMTIADVPGADPSLCEMDELSGELVCKTYASHYTYWVDQTDCARDDQSKPLQRFARCLKIVNITIGTGHEGGD